MAFLGYSAGTAHGQRTTDEHDGYLFSAGCLKTLMYLQSLEVWQHGCNTVNHHLNTSIYLAS